MALFTKDGHAIEAVQYDPLTFYKPETAHEPWVAAALAGPMQLRGSCWAELNDLTVGRSDGVLDVAHPGDWLARDVLGLSLFAIAASDFAGYVPA